MTSDQSERLLGGIYGAIIGDALGAITETLTARQIAELYGWMDDFQPLKAQPYGQDRVPGEITDDASLLLAMANVARGRDFSVEMAVRAMRTWADDPRYARYAGPSTKRALAMIQDGHDPLEAGRGDVMSFTGASNGGAMKAAPAGWMVPGDLEAAVANAAALCGPTHNTNLAIAGAAAVAAACSVAIDSGSTVDDVVRAATEGARLGAELGLRQGREVAGPDVARRIVQALGLVQLNDPRSSLDELANQIGAGLATSESVPAAIAIFALAKGDGRLCAIYSANIGDDTDTVGCMAAAIGGTFSGPTAFPQPWRELVSSANHIDVEQIAEAFIERTHHA
ncbi:MULTISPECIES: ADP-ribosylglycohydrolase family protein [unclassified Actinomyces]|uniref:ADP-ribosylglycohydrolase family protein n=1 Tax=unclassified Actinomyces TaxID=2609248 RepID=UPI0008A481A9|nr:MULTISPECIES: ADP-ribosylglycohydrolase family protein [unclassified Actinomyces]MDU4286501.1 ADP-ribosylglycohydrolase family protein [Actinomyces sp.]MDU5232310.1 ADP-ribosylglycohydrolase family protein [Actinomyces sp.]MDU6756520.1 ADP-ribosylglycohydrolase family protein [Actinomyces sp.]MDU7238564.1 ADP-ribosylglycohydrolase family protein [Actinomyces sp.]OFR31940.1 hypothetical protein HMPREF2891_02400 [Actinomyces sp. HMSC065F11]